MPPPSVPGILSESTDGFRKWAKARFFYLRPVKIDAEKIVRIADEVAREEILDLVDVEVSAAGPRAVVRIYLDREGGVRLADCESFSRKMGARLDVEDPIPGPYALEVSSPGVNRRLSRPEHFAAFAGRAVAVSLSEPVLGSRNIRGTLVSSDGEGFQVERDGRTYRIPYRILRRANLHVPMDELFGKGKKKP